jgi:LemA protein
MNFLFIFLIASVVAFLWWSYNSLARFRLMADNAWADIDVQLKRRHDLIPGLVAAVEGHADYERGTLEDVVRARNEALSASGPSASGAAEAELGGAVKRLMVLAEAYPDLKAGSSYLDLQRSLVDLEDHIQNARRYYNAVIRDYNTRVAQFPSNLVAGVFRFAPREFFGIEDAAERAVPVVDTR